MVFNKPKRPRFLHERSAISRKFDNYNEHLYICISPNVNWIATLNTSTCQLKLYNFKDLKNAHKIINFDDRYIKIPFVKKAWNLTVSNEFTLTDGTVEVLIAVSCFDNDDMKILKNKRKSPQPPPNELISAEEADVNVNDRDKSATFIISTARRLKIASPINNQGGIIKFLNTKEDDDTTELVVLNAIGITKAYIKHATIGNVNDNRKSDWSKLLYPDKLIDKYYYPRSFFKEMKRLPENETFAYFIRRSLLKDWFIIDNYKDKVQTIETYNLKTNKLDNFFRKREETVASIVGKGSPFFTISKNETLFAYCRGTNSITIYLMENGLEVTTKKFKDKDVLRILYFDFVENDSKLLIIIEEKKNHGDYWEESERLPVVVIWDLFSSSNNCVRKIDETPLLFSDNLNLQRIAIASGKLIFINDDETIFSALDRPHILKILNPENDNTRNVININSPEKSNSSSTTTLPLTEYHLVYDLSGTSLDHETVKVIVEDPEPWVQDKHYNRTTTYLDVDKTVQLIVGESTVQVWRKKKGVATDTSPKRILEYIWTNPFKEMHRRMQIVSLEVDHREFSLVVNIPSGNAPNQLGQQVIIEWPDRVNVPVDACKALLFLDLQSNEPLGPKKQHIFENIVQQTENIVKKYLVSNFGSWRMLDIRYDLMANLIRGNRVSIIRNILSFESKNGKNKNLHLPRLYSWNGQAKETDLEIAIKHSKGSYRKDTVIVKYLLDYYSDNATKNSSWMFAVSRAIPVLYEYKLEYFVKELFLKPCFGSNEIYLDKSEINIEDIINSDHKNIHALSIEIGLVKRNNDSFFISRNEPSNRPPKTKTSKNIRKIDQVYMVPLPDFTVFPDGIHDKRRFWSIPIVLLKLLFWPRNHIIEQEGKLSPFLRMIRNDYTTEIYDNPSIAAVIDYKWNVARTYFVRQALTYLAFGLSYTILSNTMEQFVRPQIPNYIIALVVLFYWLGFYLLNTERVQLKYVGWRRYFSVYNFFDLFSVILPFTAASIQLYYNLSDYFRYKTNAITSYFELDPEMFTIFDSFTILTIWLEAFLLLRYFEKTGAYIYIVMNILQNITSFLIFILLVVLGFGHTMFILLSNTDRIGIKPNGSSFRIYDENGDLVPGLTNLVINQEFDVNSTSDNYFTNFFKSIEAVYFWTSGRWDQLDQWDFWPVDVFSIIASILLVTILQNMLIAIMAGAYDQAKELSKHAVLKYRAELIADYETFDRPFGNRKRDPRYIFYIGKTEYIEKWLEKSERYRESYKNFLEEIEGGNPWSYDDENDLENLDDFQKSYHHSHSYSFSTDIDSDNLNSQRVVPLCSYWFVDEEDDGTRLLKEPDGKMLYYKMQSIEHDLSEKLRLMEDNIKQLISLQNRQ
ncbi:11986_t:CDS:2 [Funneliformis mosseae]|uniref:11986_t:CDS:1 n=1 Tax=Funneliformis mosseae TaxID=27381 RepID=A0A9N9B1N7_FUNMO|nr:11986_t:CDS:2 [Funneliformis mosseae]